MNGFVIFLAMFFEPTRGFRMIVKNRDRFRWYVPVILYALVLIVWLATIFCTSFPLSRVSPEDANLLTESLGLMLPLLSYGVSCFLVTTITDGETKMREVLTGLAYSMAPFIVLSLPIAGLSHLMSATNAGLYNAMQTAMWLWVFILFVMSVSVMNSYTIGQTIKTIFVAIFTCLFLWVVLFLMFILGQKLWEFIAKVVEEYRIHIFTK